MTAALPEPADAGAGLVLQGLTIDTAPRASGGICLSAMDVGVDWADPARRDAVTLRAQLLGGLCNDFNSRISEEYHGLVTDPDAGVKVTLYFAVVEGGEAHQGSVTASQRDRPGRRLEPAGLHLLGDEPLPPRAPYKASHTPERISNHESKGNLACLSTDGVTAAALLRSDVTWWSDLSAAPVAREAADRSSKRHDPNFQPEDGFVRWAQTAPMAAGGPACSPR